MAALVGGGARPGLGHGLEIDDIAPKTHSAHGRYLLKIYRETIINPPYHSPTNDALHAASPRLPSAYTTAT